MSASHVVDPRMARTAPTAPGEARGAGRPSSGGAGAREFGDAFARALEREGVRFSRHALERLQRRHIRMTEGDVTRIAEAMRELRGRGGRISLLLMGDTTLVTNVDQRTVITALDRYGEQNRVFTQIDSAAVIDRA